MEETKENQLWRRIENCHDSAELRKANEASLLNEIRVPETCQLCDKFLDCVLRTYGQPQHGGE